MGIALVEEIGRFRLFTTSIQDNIFGTILPPLVGSIYKTFEQTQKLYQTDLWHMAGPKDFLKVKHKTYHITTCDYHKEYEVTYSGCKTITVV